MDYFRKKQEKPYFSFDSHNLNARIRHCIFPDFVDSRTSTREEHPYILNFLILLPPCHQIASNALFKGKIGGSRVAAKSCFSFGVIKNTLGIIKNTLGVLTIKAGLLLNKAGLLLNKAGLSTALA